MNLRCPICEGSTRPVYAHPDAALHRCHDCDHCFSAPESIDTMEQYDTDYGDVAHRNWFDNPHVELFDLIADGVTSRGATSLLDVGCGRADFLERTHETHPEMELVGLERTRFTPPEGLDIRFADLEEATFDRRFDAVVSIMVVEHVVDPVAFLRRLIELCTPGGVIVTTTINDRSILYGASRALRWLRFPGPFEQLYSVHHLHHFNKSSLARAMDRSGLVIESRTDHNIPMSAVDFPPGGWLADTVRSVGVRGTFALGSLTGRCYAQTLICRAPSD